MVDVMEWWWREVFVVCFFRGCSASGFRSLGPSPFKLLILQYHATAARFRRLSGFLSGSGLGLQSNSSYKYDPSILFWPQH